MALSNPDFPSSQAFDVINEALQSDEAERKDAIKKGGCVFAFTLKNKAGKTESWHVDLKKDGTVGKGAAPSGGKADGTLDMLSGLLSSRRTRRSCSCPAS